jgi:hypothetical protein
MGRSPTISSADGPPRHPEIFLQGYCIGGPFALKLWSARPTASLASVASRSAPAGQSGLYVQVRQEAGLEQLKRRPDLDMATIEKYLHNLYRVRPDSSCTA